MQSSYLLYSFLVVEDGLKQTKLTCDFSWVVGLSGLFITLDAFLYFLHLPQWKDDHHATRNVLILGLNYQSTEDFTEYVIPKNKALFHSNIPKTSSHWHRSVSTKIYQ